MIKKLKNKILNKSDFFKSVITLMTGTAVAQAIPLAVTPLLTRLYSPEDFGLLALYLSTVSILSIVATGNYEKAIIMPKENNKAIGLIKLALHLILIVCVFIFIMIFFFNDIIASFYNNPQIKSLLIFIPFSVFSLAIYNVINTWFNRVKEYKKLSFNRVTKSSFSSILIVSLGFLKFSSLGLIVGEFVGQFFATLLFGYSFAKKNREIFKEITTDNEKELAVQYKNFPFFTLPADFLSMASYQLPVFVFAKIFSQSMVGYYSLGIRILDKPFSLLTSAIYEVFRQKAMEDYNTLGNCLQIFKKTFIRLIILGVPTMTLFYIASPFLFKTIFGAEWEIAGYYARIISIMYFFKFVASPLSFTFYIANKQKLDFILHIYVFISSSVVLAISYLYSFSIEKTLLIFVLNYSSIYSFYLFKSYQFAHGPNR